MRKTKINLKRLSKLSQYKQELASAHKDLDKAAKALKRHKIFGHIPALNSTVDLKQISKASSAALVEVESQIKARTKNGALILEAATKNLQKLGFKTLPIYTNGKISFRKKTGRVETFINCDDSYVYIKMVVKIPIMDIINHPDVQEILKKNLVRLLSL